MAGVVKRAMKSGKYRGWFMDATGKQEFFTGTTSRSETKAIAERLEDEHRQVRLGYREAPKSSDHHKADPIDVVVDEYMSWGRTQGGRHGRPWSKDHARLKALNLGWWVRRLDLKTLGDIDADLLRRVDGALRELDADGRAGKTVESYKEALCSFIDWCVKRNYLADDPLKNITGWDKTPTKRRRALTPEEINKLLTSCRPQYRLLYQAALFSGLRANELRSLTVADLHVDQGGLTLSGQWTKNRSDGFQPLPRDLVAALADAAKGRDADAPLFFVPLHTADVLYRDLKSAGILKDAPGGRVDFHSLRLSFINMMIEGGGSVKECMDLARHSTADLTLNVYGRSRWERRSDLVEKAAERVLLAVDSDENYAHSMHLQAVGAEIVSDSRDLETDGSRFKSCCAHHS